MSRSRGLASPLPLLGLLLILISASVRWWARLGEGQSAPEPQAPPVSQVTPSAEGEITPEDLQKPALTFLATAYALPGQTASGKEVRIGIVAADPKILPLGSIIHVRAGRYSGIYQVLDTGEDIRGRRLDIWMPSVEEARAFGVRRVQVRILRWGGSSPDTGEQQNLN